MTSDPYAIQLAKEYEFEIIPDPENPGETGAIEMATQVCVERGEDSTLVIPADIPLIQAWELEEILQARTRARKRAGSRGRWTRHERCFPASGESIPIAISAMTASNPTMPQRRQRASRASC